MFGQGLQDTIAPSNAAPSGTTAADLLASLGSDQGSTDAIPVTKDEVMQMIQSVVPQMIQQALDTAKQQDLNGDQGGQPVPPLPGGM